MEIPEEIRLRILERIGRVVKAKAIRLAPIDMGHLRASINFKIVSNSVLISCSVPYAKDMEYGKPPEPNMSKEDEQNILDWAARHNMNLSQGMAVVRKIKAKGIAVGTPKQPLRTPIGTYRPFMRPALIQCMPEIKQIVVEELSK